MAQEKELEISQFKIEEEEKWSHFSLKMLPAKAASFFYFGPKYLIMTFLVPFLTDIGLQTYQAGVIIGLRYIVQVIGALVLGAIADRSKRHSLITILAISISIIAVLIMVVLAYVLVPESNVIDSIIASNQTSINGTILSLNNTTSDAKTPDEVWKVSIFWISLCFYSIYAFFDGCLNGFVDAVTISICSAFGKNNSYYWQRFWGSFAYSVLPLLAGFIVDVWEFKVISKYMPVIFLFWFCQLTLFFPLLKIIRQFNMIETPKEEELTKSKTKWHHVMFHPDIAVCLSLQVLFGIGTGVEFGFLLKYMEDSMINGTALVYGMAVFSQCITEAFTSPIVGVVRKFITDPYLCMSIGILGYAIGFLCYSFAENAYIIVGVNLLYGFSYPLFNFPAQSECYRICPKDYLSTLFSFSASCYTGIGCGLGSVIGGIMYFQIGGRYTYLSAYGLFQVCCCTVPIYAFLRRFRKEKENENEKHAVA